MTHSMTRRGMLAGAAACGVLPMLSGCAAVGLGASTTPGTGGQATALLLPLTGAAAGVGQNMARAASLVTQGDEASAPKVYDTGDTADGAATAAKAAIAAGAKILMGPLKADQTPAVLAVAGRVPVITFSNDDGLADQGAFVMGITPAQSVSTMFSYARAQGITKVAVVARPGALGEATATAARQIGAAGGIEITAVLLTEPGGNLALNGAQAVFLPDGGKALAGFARSLNGVQLLGSVQWGITDIEADGNLAGAWFAAPPPDLFLPFADRFEAAFGEAPGVVAGLGHDAALLAVGLGNGKGVSRKGITRAAGFTGVLGGFRFLSSGRCQRDLSVLTLNAGNLSVLAEVTGT